MKLPTSKDNSGNTSRRNFDTNQSPRMRMTPLSNPEKLIHQLMLICQHHITKALLVHMPTVPFNQWTIRITLLLACFIQMMSQNHWIIHKTSPLLLLMTLNQPRMFPSHPLITLKRTWTVIHLERRLIPEPKQPQQMCFHSFGMSSSSQKIILPLSKCVVLPTRIC